MLNTNRTK